MVLPGETFQDRRTLQSFDRERCGAQDCFAMKGTSRQVDFKDMLTGVRKFKLSKFFTECTLAAKYFIIK